MLSTSSLPGNPSKIHRISDTLFIDFCSQNDSQNEPQIIIKLSFHQDRNPPLFFSHSGAPNGAHEPRKQQYCLRKTSISTNPPFAFWSSFWHQKVSQNMPKTTLKPLNKTSRKHIQTRHQIWKKMDSKWPPKWAPKSLINRPGGHFGPHGILIDPKRTSTAPREPKRRSKAPLGHHS